jgi:4-hydroxyphenylpyruvate dioxygenase-like putative hemolysin
MDQPNVHGLPKLTMLLTDLDLPTTIDTSTGDMAASVRVNTEEAAWLTFDHIAQDLIEDLIDNYFKFYKQVTDDQTARSHFFDWLFEQYLQKHGGIQT